MKHPVLPKHLYKSVSFKQALCTQPQEWQGIALEFVYNLLCVSPKIKLFFCPKTSGVRLLPLGVEGRTQWLLLNVFSSSPLHHLFPQKGLYQDFEILHGLLTNNNIKIPHKNNQGPPLPPQYAIFGRTRGGGVVFRRGVPRVLKFCMGN